MQARPAHADRERGFTLIEMLIAIAIFSVMTITSYRVLDTLFTSRQHVSEEYRRWRDVARALARIERDLHAIQARPVRDASDRLLPPLVGTATGDADAPALAFTRSGNSGEPGQMLPPSRIAYRVRAGQLERLAWPGLDQAPSGAPTVTVMLAGVAALDARYCGASADWHAMWPLARAQRQAGDADSHARRGEAADTTLPVAVDVSIKLANGARIERLIPLHGRTPQ